MREFYFGGAFSSDLIKLESVLGNAKLIVFVVLLGILFKLTFLLASDLDLH